MSEKEFVAWLRSEWSWWEDGPNESLVAPAGAAVIVAGALRWIDLEPG